MITEQPEAAAVLAAVVVAAKMTRVTSALLPLADEGLAIVRHWLCDLAALRVHWASAQTATCPLDG